MKLLQQLSEARGPAGWEDEVRAIFRESLKGIGEGCQVDRLGSIYCPLTNGGDKPRIMLCAHMDEVGFIVNEIMDNGFLRFLPLGGWWGHVLPGQRVWVRTISAQWRIGVIGAVPPHLQGNEAKSVLEPHEMFLDVGGKDRDDVEKNLGIRTGAVVVPATRFEWLRDRSLCLGKAFDDRAGLALVIETLQELAGESLQVNIIGAGSVQEEVGCRGAGVLANHLKPDLAIILECAPADDIPDLPRGPSQGKLGAGVQIRLLDPTTIMSRGLVELALRLAEEQGIPHQIAVRKSGGTDAKSIHLAHIGVPSLVLGVPARYIHSHVAVMDASDYQAARKLVLALLRHLSRETCSTILYEKD